MVHIFLITLVNEPNAVALAALGVLSAISLGLMAIIRELLKDNADVKKANFELVSNQEKMLAIQEKFLPLIPLLEPLNRFLYGGGAERRGS